MLVGRGGGRIPEGQTGTFVSQATPELSVVIAAASGREHLAECLEGLRRQEDHVAAEVIVVMAEASDLAEFVRHEYPHVRRLALGRDPSVPRLRAAGIREARGGIVAITEDHCIPTPTWYQAIRQAHAERSSAAIGGVVDNAATGSLVDWAVYYREYGGFASPMRPGPAAELPGPNVSYKRGSLEMLRQVISDEYWETFVHDELRRRGEELWCEPSIRVLHKMHFGFVESVAERYHYGRAYAGTRNQLLRWPGRVMRMALWPLLIPLFVLRTSTIVLGRPGNGLRFVCCLPIVCCLAAAAAIGEGVGYACGAGNSALRLR